MCHASPRLPKETNIEYYYYYYYYYYYFYFYFYFYWYDYYYYDDGPGSTPMRGTLAALAASPDIHNNRPFFVFAGMRRQSRNKSSNARRERRKFQMERPKGRPRKTIV